MKNILRSVLLVLFIFASFAANSQIDAAEGMEQIIDNIGQTNGGGISADGATNNDLVVDDVEEHENPNEGSIQAYRQEELYKAQQRAIRAMAEALYMKRALNILGSVHHDGQEKIKNQYSNTKSTLATLAARRGLYNSLLTFKYQIATVRARLRAEAMELDILPVASDVEVVSSPVIKQSSVRVGVVRRN